MRLLNVLIVTLSMLSFGNVDAALRLLDSQELAEHGRSYVVLGHYANGEYLVWAPDQFTAKAIVGQTIEPFGLVASKQQPISPWLNVWVVDQAIGSAVQDWARKHAIGSELLFARSVNNMTVLTLRFTEKVRDRVARLPGLVGVELAAPPQWLNADSVGPLQGNAPSGGIPPLVSPIWDQGIIGTGQIVAVADSGLDRNEGWFTSYYDGSQTVTAITDAESTQPPALGTIYPNRKVVAYWVMPGASAYDDNQNCGSQTNFHGTHVTGTVAGDAGVVASAGNPAYDAGDGLAPHAQLLFQDLGNDTTGCLAGEGGAPMWQQALGAGAYISSNSYGSFVPNQYRYTSSDAELDDFLWRNQDMLIVVAAGNSGTTAGAILHPGHAKHALTVGALLHGDSTTIAGYSSRGPASDGRIKPDIMAPGSSIRSASGDDNDTSVDAPTSRLNSGTSMATPAIAASAALVRQYFDNGFYPTGDRQPIDATTISGSMLKAVLLNGTRTFADTPSAGAGWGRAWLDNNLYFTGDDRRLRVFERSQDAGIEAGEMHSYSVDVPAGQPFRATLVWYDPAPAPGAPAALVNNLDLSVVGAGQTYLGNQFAAGDSVPGGTADDINPVEQVLLDNPAAGTYEITVGATSVPGNGEQASLRQSYALVVSAADCAAEVADAPAFTLSTDATGVAVDAVLPTSADSIQIYRAQGTCASPESEFRMVGHTGATSFLDATTQSGLSYAYRLRGADVCAEGPVSTCQEIVSQVTCTTWPEPPSAVAAAPQGDFCAAQIEWQAGSAVCPNESLTYELHRTSTPDQALDGGTLVASDLVATSYFDIAPPAGITSYYSVVAVDGLGNRSLPSEPAMYAGVSTETVLGTFSDSGESLTFVELEAPWSLDDTVASDGAVSFHNAPTGATYPSSTCASALLPNIQLGASAQLDYDARFDLEESWDGVVVEVSTNDGVTWAPITPSQGYPGSFALTMNPPINACGFPQTQGAFTGSSSGVFETYTHDLSSFSGERISVRWRFSSDPGTELTGFHLDNIQIQAAEVPQACVADELLFVNGYE